MKAEIVVGPADVTGESPVWCDRRRCLWWVDVLGGALHRLVPETGTERVWTFGEPLACLALTDGNALLLGLQSGLALFDSDTGKLGTSQPLEPDLPGNRPNDAAMSRDGRWFVGTMAMVPDGTARGALYRQDPDGAAHRVLTGLHVANGLAVSPEADRLYLSDSWHEAGCIWRFDLSPEGALSNRRLLHDLRGSGARPDGGCVDAEGCYWSAGIDGGRLIRFTPEGRIDREITLPVSKPSKACFGGKKLDTMYITSLAPGDAGPNAGAVLALNPGVTGLPEPRRRL
ncbi:SMP-30/gluconolactonase/LRE family protein [Salipiger sp. PrR007]|uniref:SMP-30/gluconolactonase/LRE family protein n=1 Tax=Salipiger sp. PrR007 TaxID=2706884 RepID=UPI0013BDC9B4|nr:SMP-30/gluconolactonase/LRE family protein [Salipiger sp. PrR007]NDW33412.1 SMP-30/gluconolactonase/LRE family protein [Salipiger sp. PrR007]